MSTRPDKDLFIEAAKIKRMKESFVEKDWLVTQVIGTISTINQKGFEVIFTGGTALSKAHNLICRFSEDVDFRILVEPEFLSRKNLSNYKHAVIDALRADGFAIEDHHVKARDENRFFSIDLEYETAFPREGSLRPHIQIEMTARDIQLEYIVLSVSSFINELQKLPPEVPFVGCIDPAESAADKLSALAWRIPDRIRGGQYDDPSIVRHIHDLAMLRYYVLDHPQFPALVTKSMQEDDRRAKNDLTLEGMPMAQKLQKMLDILVTDTAYADEYRRFVEDVSYAHYDLTPNYESALKDIRVLVESVKRRYVLWCAAGSTPRSTIRQRDETGERSVSLSKMVLYYKTHLALLRKH